MAIYKPSNCVPFMDSWDLTQEHNIEFELNTNNTISTGYKLKVLDSKNNVIFSGRSFEKFPNGQKGYNGSVITAPLIKSGKPEFAEALENVIYFQAGSTSETETIPDKWFKKGETDFEEITNFFNGYPNQPYKWVVTLCQGSLNSAELTKRDYDMEVDSGYILGSTPNRIQSELSEYIYKNNFIQLLNADGNPIGTRALIDSYDHTYGYIYPLEGSLGQTNIDNAVYFNIYKGTNDPEAMDAGRILKYETSSAISDWAPGSYPYYFTFTGSTIGGISVSNLDVGNSILVKNQGDSSAGYMSPYNGVFTLQTKEGSGTSTKTTWLRSSTANTWAKIINNNFFVTNTGKIYTASNEVNKNTFGTLNETPISFIIEQPIEIYPNKIDDNEKIRGRVFKTNEKVIKEINVVAGTGTGVEMGSISVYGNNSTQSLWKPNEEGYFVQEFGSETGNNIPKSAMANGEGFLAYYLSGTKVTYTTGSFVKVNDLILVKGETEVNKKYNGIFVLKSVEGKEGANSDYYSNVTLTWERYDFLNEWVDFSSFIFNTPIYSSTSANDIHTYYNSSSVTQGIFNETEINFAEGKIPLIYNKNVYVRPFIGLDTGMLFEYQHGLETGEIKDVTINTDNWYVQYTYTEGVTTIPDFIPDVDTYKILSYFKTSDENPFYAFENPVIKITKINNQTIPEGAEDNGKGDTITDPIKIYSRVINAEATYNQVNNKQWVNYQWILSNEILNDYRQTDVIYSGPIGCNFAGIEKSENFKENPYIYTLQLIVEDELGNKLSITKYIKIDDNVEITSNPFTNNIEQIMDCNLHSFGVSFGVINTVIPSNEPGDINIKEDYIKYEWTETPKQTGKMMIPDSLPVGKDDSAAQSYVKTEVGAGSGFDSVLPIPLGDDLTLNSQHSNLSSYFENELLKMDIVVTEKTNEKELTITTNSDIIKDDSGLKVENPKRNLISVGYTGVEAIDFKWREKQPIMFSMQKDLTAKEGYDYLFTERAYVYENQSDTEYSSEIYKNLTETYNTSGENYSGSPFVTNVVDNPSDDDYGIWSNENIVSKFQSDKTRIGVLSGNLNTIPSNKEEAAKCTWCDKNNYGCYIQKNVNAENNHSGRQNFPNQEEFTFNIVVKKYKTELPTLTVNAWKGNNEWQKETNGGNYNG